MNHDNLKKLPIFDLALTTAEVSGMMTSVQPWLSTIAEQVENSQMPIDKKRQIRNKIAQIEIDVAKDAANIVMETLTQEEMIALVIFCSTDMGRSIVSKTQPILSQVLKLFSERFKVFQKEIRGFVVK